MTDEAKTPYAGDWELIEGGVNAVIQQFRQRVPGGWLVLCSTGPAATMTFLSDPTGEWSPPLKQSRKKGFA